MSGSQQYVNTQPSLGANFYATYAATPGVGNVTPSYGGPSQLQQLGIRPGMTVAGHFATSWTFTVSTATQPAGGLAAGGSGFVSVTPGPTMGQASAGPEGDGILAGTVLVAIPTPNAANAGLGYWMQTGPQPISLTPFAGMGPEPEEGERQEQYR